MAAVTTTKTVATAKERTGAKILRVNQEQASRQRTKEQRDEYAPKPPPFIRRLGPINESLEDCSFDRSHRYL